MKQSHRCGVGCHWCDRKGCSWNENMFGKISSNWILAKSILYIFSSHVREDNTKNFAKARSVKQKFFASSLTIEPGFYLRRLSEKWYKWPPLIPPEFDAEQQKNGWLFRTGAMRSIRIFRNKFWRSLQTLLKACTVHCCMQGFGAGAVRGAGAFGWGRSRHFGPAPAPVPSPAPG